MLLWMESCAQKPIVADFDVKKQLSSPHQVVIYPNPANRGDILKIKSSLLVKNVVVTNMIGVEICNQTNEFVIYDDLQLKIDNCTPGIYYAKITFEDNKSVIKKVIMK